MILNLLLVGGMLIHPTVPISEVVTLERTCESVACVTPTSKEVKQTQTALVLKQKEIEAKKKAEEESWINGVATAYYNGKDRMNGETGVTASGYDLDNGTTYKGYRILAGAKNIPLGTVVEIRLPDGSTMKGVVLDRGGAITSHRFDIVMETYQDCIRFGRRGIKYKIIGSVEL